MGIGIMAGRMESALTRDLVTRSLRRQLGRASVVLMWKNGARLSRSILSFMDDLSELE